MKRVLIISGWVVLGLVVAAAIVIFIGLHKKPFSNEFSVNEMGKPVSMITVIIPGDTAQFLMGSTDEEIASQPSMKDRDYITRDEQPAHQVTLTVPYEMSKYEITNFQFAQVMNWAIDTGQATCASGDLTSPQGVKYLGIANMLKDRFLGVQYGLSIENEHLKVADNSVNHPVHGVTWFGAAAFCSLASKRDGREPVYDLSTWSWTEGKNGYRLPTEAEWEYAARGHERLTYAWGNQLTEKHANFVLSRRPFGTITMPVGFYDGASKYGIETQNNASPLGIYDMTGNVWEWTWDWYGADYYRVSPALDPRGPETGEDRPPYDIKVPTRVWRGCGWAGNDAFSRVAKRWSAAADVAINEVGFRVVRTLF